MEKYSKTRLQRVRNGDIRFVRNPEKYKAYLSEDEYIELTNRVIPLETIENKLDELYSGKTNTLLKHKSSIRGIFTLFELANIEDLFNIPILEIKQNLEEKYSYPKCYYSVLNIIFDNYSFLKTKYQDYFDFIVENRKIKTFKENTFSFEQTQELYNKILNHQPEKDFDKLIHIVYTKAIYDENDKLIFIPNNCFTNIRIKYETDEEITENFYNYDTGNIKLLTYDYKVKPEVRSLINKIVDINPRLYLFGDRKGANPINSKLLNSKLIYGLGVKLNDYRRAFKICAI